MSFYSSDDLNLKHAYHDLGVNCDISFDEFRKFCLECWRQKYGFVVIDQDSEANNGRYRRNFNEFLQVHKNEN